MTPIAVYLHDPNADLPYAIDWSAWLDTGETMTAVVWTVPVGLTGHDSSFTSAGVARLFLSGGVAETNYTVACKITTSTTPPRIDERSITIRCRQR